MLTLRVGEEETLGNDGGGGGADLDMWLTQLKNTVNQKESEVRKDEVGTLVASATRATPQNYENMGRTILMHIRDQGQSKLAQIMHRFTRQITKTQDPDIIWEPALGPDEYVHLTSVVKVTPNLDRYYQLQEQLSEQLVKSDLLEKQWSTLPVQAAEVPQTRTVLRKLFQTAREGHQEWLFLSRGTTEKLWKLRGELVDAYVMLVQDTVKSFGQEGEKILSIHQQVKTELENQIKASESNEFFHDFTRLHDNFRFWVESINNLLPPSLKLHQQVDQFLHECDTVQDPCCLRRVQHLKDQLERISSILVLHRDTQQHRKLATDSLQQELSMTSTEWSQTQAQLETVQRDLQDLSGKRVMLWSKDKSSSSTLSELEELERQQLDLEHKQEVLLEKIAPLRAALERLRTQNTDVLSATQFVKALEQAENWRVMLNEFQQRCEKESQLWSEGRGLQYRARVTVQEETLKTLQSLFVTAQQKIDGAGLALVRYGLLLVQNLYAGAVIQHHAVKQKQTIAQSSISHYIQRLALSHPAMAELLHQHSLSETALYQLRNELEEIQLQNMVTLAIKATTDKVSSSILA